MANDKNFKVKNGVSVGTDVVFEGNNFTTTLTKTEPSANRTITFPNASGTVVLGDGLTTYSVKASSTTGGANLDLDAAGANTNTDSVKFAGAGITTVTQTDASTITITSTEADTLATVTGRGATTGQIVSITNTTAATSSAATAALFVSGGLSVGIGMNLAGTLWHVGAYDGTGTIKTTNTTTSTSSSTGSLVVGGGAGIAENLNVGGNIVVSGNLTVQGTQTTISTATLEVTDKTIELGVIATPTNTTADGGGIILKGTTDKTILWDDANTNWTSSEHWNLATGKSFKINNTEVLSSTQVLGKGFTNAAGEIVTTDGTQTLTNKTISGGSASNLTGLSMTAGVTINEFSSDGTLAGNSNDAVPTEAAVRTYVGNSLTTYSVKASSTTGGANLDLDAAGANTNTDSIKFAGAGSVSIAQTDVNTITVTGATPGNGALTLQIGGTAAATNNTVTVSTGSGFSANSSAASTYELRIGPALTALASQMTGTGTGFLRKNGADTFNLDTSSYQPLDADLTAIAGLSGTNGFLKKTAADTWSLDTNTYLTAEADTLATVTGRGATTATDITLGNGVTTSNTYFGASLNNYLVTTGNGMMRIQTKDQTTTDGKDIYLEAGDSSANTFGGGNIYLIAGNGTGTNSFGGSVSIQGGSGTGSGAGFVSISGGESNLGEPGSATFKGGDSSKLSGTATGGAVIIQGGNAPVSNGATSKIGGDVYIHGGGVSGTNVTRYGNIYVGTSQNGNTSGTQEVHIGNASSKNYIKGVTEYTTSTEVLNTKTGATGTVVHNLTEGNTWYHSSIAANFTANFTNVPTTNNRTIVCSLVLVQGSTAYIPNAVQIDGVAQAINWTGHNGIPTGDANDTNIATFVLIRQSNSWSVLGSVVNNPAAAAVSTLQAVTDAGATTSNAISITNATESTSTSTGALKVSGGVGIGGNVFVGNQYHQGSGTNADLGNGSDVVFGIKTQNNGGIAVIQSDTGSAGLKVVGTGATSGFGIVIAEGNGTMSLVSPDSTNGGGIEAGRGPLTIRGAGQALNGSYVAQDIVLYTSYNQPALTIAGADKSVTIHSTTSSNSTVTGALVVNGGLGVGGNITAGSVVFSNTDPNNTGSDTVTAPYIEGDTGVYSPLFNNLAGDITIGFDQAGTGVINFQRQAVFQQTSEVLNSKTGATGVVTHDFSTGAIWYHSSISANFTANFTNVPTTNDRAINIVLVLVQGATPYIPNAVQIAGVAQTINWQGGSAPSGNASKRDLVSFTLIRTGSAWTVLGSLTTYG